ncbi:hypothetical protein BSI_04580 [Bacillus inaquosorum KCTC 13429]|uniref:Uncharacterized protein n=1 Tax=Bacillus inaquosorum KCTC 13429 TaxID=1236548 RepID=A0A9W5LLT6_9BACI|nr:hypothetical protein BSI_04580 [Bacillus inaquosorum KCTC 13429]
MPAVSGWHAFFILSGIYPQQSYFQINPSYMQITMAKRKTIK